jgi:sugar phosphate isomerase/epimerase
MDIFKNRLLTTHIHDNNGRPEDPKGDGDLHLMPFEGDVDYAQCIADLDKYNYEGAPVLELTNARYEEMDPKEFIAKAYENLKKISEMSK